MAKRLWFGGAIALLVLLPLGGGWLWWSWALGAISPQQPQRVQFWVRPGMGGQEIGQELQRLGAIRSAQAWKFWIAWQSRVDRQGSFKSGTYRFSTGEDLPTIAGKIWRGEVMTETFTIPEGWNRFQMATLFAERGYFTAEAFLKAVGEVPRDRYPWLPPSLPHVEGFLYPDTYTVGHDQLQPEAIRDLMLSRFATVALPIYRGDPQPPLNLKDWVTLGSIVEKEAVIAAERPRIAGVFFQRLAKGMKLETDPTVEYGLRIRQTADQPLTLAQVRTPNPYNTYRNFGLPPTPIASPGQGSLQAVLRPEKTPYLYFVARYDGTHIFSTNLGDHEAAARRIRAARNAPKP